VLLVIAIVAGIGLVVMSLETNSAFGQWILPSSELKNAHKQGYPESNATTTTITDEEEENTTEKW
jgi:hypothetical protein